jgi:IMP dehydrogenase
MQRTLCFDDVLLTPQYSEIESRSNVNLFVTGFDDKVANLISGYPDLTCPIIGSPMDTVIGPTAAALLDELGGFGILHRYCTINEAVNSFLKVIELRKTPENISLVTNHRLPNVMVAIGATGDFLERAAALYDAGCRTFCIDVAHGHHSSVKSALAVMRNKFGNDVHIMTGNVATLEAFNDLADWGSSSIRVGVGGGCFIPDTLITMADGTKKPIENVRIGDFVLTHTGETKEVINLFEKPFSDLLVKINDVLTCT